jgi:hypothetical protein
MKKWFVLAALIFLSTILYAYPIPPRPLRKLVIESQFIVYGTVIELGTLPPDKDDNGWERDYARVLVKETWQGEIKEDTIMVFYTKHMLCPAPAEYVAGRDMITFIDKLENKKGYTPKALSYGVKNYLNEQGIALYKKRIAEIKNILKIRGEEERSKKILEWLVVCAESKATEWEGVYELANGGDFMKGKHGSVCENPFLTTELRKKIFNIVIHMDQLGYRDIQLADIITGVDNVQLFALLKKSLLEANAEYVWVVSDIMKRILWLSPNKKMQAIYQQLARSSGKLDDEKEKLYEDFIRWVLQVEAKDIITAQANATI